MAEIMVEAKAEKLTEVLAFLDQELESAGCSFKAQMKLEIALEEMFVNIAQYAYPDGEGSTAIRVQADGTAREVTVTLEDCGIPYNPLERPDPDTTLSSEDRPVGGLGIFMVRQSMDSVAYEYRDGKNLFTMKKLW